MWKDPKAKLIIRARMIVEGQREHPKMWKSFENDYEVPTLFLMGTEDEAVCNKAICKAANIMTGRGIDSEISTYEGQDHWYIFYEEQYQRMQADILVWINK